MHCSCAAEGLGLCNTSYALQAPCTTVHSVQDSILFSTFKFSWRCEAPWLYLFLTHLTCNRHVTGFDPEDVPYLSHKTFWEGNDDADVLNAAYPVL